MKTCACCEQSLDDEQFYIDQKSGDGLSSYCKECKKKARARHYAQNPITGTQWDKQHKERAKKRKSKYRQNRVNKDLKTLGNTESH